MPTPAPSGRASTTHRTTGFCRRRTSRPHARTVPAMAKRDPREHDALVESNEQPFLEHVIELRARILRSLLAIAVAFVPTYYFANDIYEFVAAPLMRHLPENSTMIATAVASPFLTPFRLAIYAAAF